MNNDRFGFRRFLRFVVPSVSAMLVYSLYSLVDGAFLARYVGEDALAAVNISMPFINALFAAAVLLSVGASTVAAIHLGAGERDKANAVFTQNTCVVAGAALVITVLARLFTPELARLLGAEGGNFGYVVDYLGTVCLFAVCLMTSYSMEVMVKTGGHPDRSFIAVAMTFCVNVVLDYVFVARLGWSVTGAAVATGIAQLAAVIFYLAHFLSGRSRLRFVLTRPQLSLYKRIIPLGLSEFLSEMALAVTVFLYNRALLLLMGEKGTVMFAVVSYVNQIALVLFAGVTQGVEPLVSYELGAGRAKNCRGYFRIGRVTVAVLAALSFCLCQLFAPGITGLLLEPDSSVFAPTVEALRWFSLSFLFAGFNLIAAGYLSAMERPWLAVWVSPLRAVGLLVPAMLALTAALGADGIWLSSALAELLCIGVTWLLLRRAGRRPVS